MAAKPVADTSDGVLSDAPIADKLIVLSMDLVVVVVGKGRAEPNRIELDDVVLIGSSFSFRRRRIGLFVCSEPAFSGCGARSNLPAEQ